MFYKPLSQIKRPDKVKTILFFTLVLLSIPLFTLTQQQAYDATNEIMQLQNQQPQLTQSQQQMVTVGSNFANIVLNALSIMANKDDTQVLSNSLSGIMNSFVSIAIEASKGNVKTDSIDDIISAIKNFCENLNEEDMAFIKSAINKQVKINS